MVDQGMDDVFEQVRQESDPIRQAVEAGRLINLYQQRGVELARLRKEAINRAAEEQGKTFSAIADEIGLTRGRIAQIRKAAPPAEREFFGTGPITVAVPLRDMGRDFPLVAEEDTRSGETISTYLQQMSFQVKQFRIPTNGDWEPEGDVFAICGPKSSPVTARAIADDPALDFLPHPSGNWMIVDRSSGEVWTSPMDSDRSAQADIAYVAHINRGRNSMIIVAGVHAIGSLGAVDFLVRELPRVYRENGTDPFSMVVGSEYEGLSIRRSYVVCPPHKH